MNQRVEVKRGREAGKRGTTRLAAGDMIYVMFDDNTGAWYNKSILRRIR